MMVEYQSSTNINASPDRRQFVLPSVRHLCLFGSPNKTMCFRAVKTRDINNMDITNKETLCEKEIKDQLIKH